MTNVLKGLPTRTQIQHSPEYYKDTVKRGVGSLKAWFRKERDTGLRPVSGDN